MQDTGKKAEEVLVKTGIYTQRELDARVEILYHNYVLKIETEAKLMVEIVTNQIVPAALTYTNKLIENVKGLKDIGVAATAGKAQKDLAASIATNVNNLIAASAKLAAASDKAHHAKSTEAAAKAYNDAVKPLLEEVRSYADALEKVVDDNVWPMPKYRELLFIR